ncbi:MAG: GAF domain-containing protein [Vallitaleaceae bacterium]|nr:GAF domain-containing protein [Vallitaleaceae bacterium]
MFHITKDNYSSKEAFYNDLLLQAKGLIEGETDLIANLANVSSLLFNLLEDVNWAGFYLFKENQLVLGPFHGNPACIRIAIGRGVCGTAAQTSVTQVIKDVHAFAGHIACDGNTKSEIVVPMLQNQKLIGVLDIDSVVLGKFDDVDKDALEQLISMLMSVCKI